MTRINRDISAFGFAVAAAVAIKVPVLFGLELDTDATFYARNASLFVLPFLAAWFAWERRFPAGTLIRLAVAFVAAAVFANAYPFVPGGSTETLAALHLPIALWLAVGMAHAGNRWAEPGRRMEFVRFSGEMFIRYVLIALGGGVTMALTAALFTSIGIDVEPFFESWILPCGAAGGILVAALLVESKQHVIGSFAPVLARIFSPLFALLLWAFLTILFSTGRGIDIERNVLIAFDLLLVLVFGLVLYSVSARSTNAPVGAFDFVQVALLAGALLADSVALIAMAARITDFGVSPNRVAALGVNFILLANLAGSIVLYGRLVLGRGSFVSVELWQTRYLTVFVVWAVAVTILFPPMFGYR